MSNQTEGCLSDFFKKCLTIPLGICIIGFVRCEHGILAQLGEHLPYKQRVIGSSPIGPTYRNDFEYILIHFETYGGIAQLARAHGSYPWCQEFKSLLRYEQKGRR